jgi:hypothetical protein
MAITLVQSASANYSGSGSRAIAFGSNNTLGNALFCLFNSHANSGSVADTQLNTWISLGFIGSSNTSAALFWLPSCKAGANTVTISSGSGSIAGTIAEVSGVDTLDQTSGSPTTGTGAGSTWGPTGAITTINANEFIVGLVASGNGGNQVNSPFGLLGSNESFFEAFYEIVSSIQTGLTASGTLNNLSGNTWSMSIWSFYKSANSPLPPLLPEQMYHAPYPHILTRM